MGGEGRKNQNLSTQDEPKERSNPLRGAAAPPKHGFLTRLPEWTQDQLHLFLYTSVSKPPGSVGAPRGQSRLSQCPRGGSSPPLLPSRPAGQGLREVTRKANSGTSGCDGKPSFSAWGRSHDLGSSLCLRSLSDRCTGHRGTGGSCFFSTPPGRPCGCVLGRV